MAPARAVLRTAGAPLRSPPSLSGSALASEQVEACGAHSNVSCGPPRPEASARATLWVANAQPFSVEFVLGAPPAPAFGVRCAPSSAIPEESRYSLSAQSTPPVLRPVSASLRLRLRSAAFATRWDFISILLTAKRAKSLLLKAGGRRIFARSRGFSRACAIHLYSATAEIVESLL